MRAIFVLALVFASAAANAAALDPARIAAIDQAAGAFLAKAAEAKKSGMVPRQSDPAIGALLDTVFDTRDLSHGPVPYADFDKLDDWETRIVRVGQVYVVASRALRDFGIFAAEIGRYFDAVVAVMQATADTLATEAADHPEEQRPVTERRKVAEMHAAIVKNLSEIIGKGLTAPGLTVGWVRQRLLVLTGAAPSLARFLKPDELAQLRRAARSLEFRDKSLRTGVGALAVALAEPRAPIATSAEAASANSEITLGSEHGGYSVSGRVNGAMTIKFVLDSGASVVALPQDLVDTLTQSGSIAPSDILGRQKYVAADGKRHKSTSLLLRRIEVGGHTATNVEASVLPAHAEPLLGLSFLAKFKSWTLDNKRHVLIITD